MKLDPTAVFAPYFGAVALAFAGRYAEARPLFQRTLEIEPRHGWALLGLGFTHLELGSTAEAVWCLEQAVEVERLRASHTAGVAGSLGECLRRAGDLEGARARCLEGLEAVEKSDSMYRDTFRAACLVSLGRTALAQGDAAAAKTAFAQAVSHLRGRPRALAGGYLLVQALAGLARAGEGSGPYEEAVRLYRERPSHDFSFMWVGTDDATLLELSRAAAAVGRPAEAADFLGARPRRRIAGSGVVVAPRPLPAERVSHRRRRSPISRNVGSNATTLQPLSVFRTVATSR